MYDHIGISVRDLGASVRFYEALLRGLGYELGHRDESSAGFGPPNAPAFWLYLKPSQAAATHVAFRAADHAAVQRCHAAGRAAGGRDYGAPGPRPDYGPTYYAAFLLDPDGNNVEVVCP